MPELRLIQVMRYITPLREGGSLPAIVEGDDGFHYVLKFRGAGQGTKALNAEIIGGELARAAGFKIPEIVFAELDPQYGKSEPDEEIQDLLKASEGLNLGLHYLSGSITYDPVVFRIDPLMASKIVWLDAFIMNVDRTPRNTNMLVWHNELWLIDHGAALYFHHTWDNWEEQSVKPFTQIKDHVLMPFASKMEEADIFMRSRINLTLINDTISLIPAGWLKENEESNIYSKFLLNRLLHADNFVTEIKHARQSHL